MKEALALALLFALARRMRAYRAPYAVAKWWRNCPQGGSHGCEPVGCQSKDGLPANPGTASRSRRAGARRPLQRGGLLFGYFLLATQEKVTRSTEASEKRQGCRAPQARALETAIQEQSHKVIGPCMRRGDEQE